MPTENRSSREGAATTLQLRPRGAPSPTRAMCGCWSDLELEPKHFPDDGQRLEDAIGRFGRADLLRVFAEQHGCVDGGTRLLRRQALDLTLVDQPAHVAEERLGSARRLNPGHHFY